MANQNVGEERSDPAQREQNPAQFDGVRLSPGHQVGWVDSIEDLGGEAFRLIDPGCFFERPYHVREPPVYIGVRAFGRFEPCRITCLAVGQAVTLAQRSMASERAFLRRVSYCVAHPG